MMALDSYVHDNSGTEYTVMLPKIQPDVCPLGISVLAVSSYPQDHRKLSDIFRHSRWQLRTASTVREATSILRDSSVPVVICEYQLPDGDWRTLNETVKALEVPSNLLVTLRHADERTWGEILDGGGYDCLPKPFCSDEVFRLVSLAWRSWKDQQDRLNQRARQVGSAAHG